MKLRNLLATNRGLIVVVLICLFDSFFADQGIWALSIILLTAFWFVPKALYMSQKGQKPWTPLLRCTIFLALAISVLMFRKSNSRLAHERADTLIAVVEQFHADHGKYPDGLQELVPDYLEFIPAPKRKSGFCNYFHYFNEAGSAHLYYIATPPFGKRYYSFETKKWRLIG